MHRSLRLALAGLALAAPLAAQEVKVDALFIGWYVQNMDTSMRNNTAVGSNLAATSPTNTSTYYGLGGTGTPNPYQNGGFSVRRMEVYLAAKITDDVSANLMFDPNQSAPNLFDAFITYKPAGAFEVKVGQFKPLQTFEATSVAAADLIFIDRAQLARRIGDDRDRGLTAALNFGDKAFGGKATIGFFNGAVRSNDNNAQKDVVARLDFNVGSEHKFGVYTLQGETDLTDKVGGAVTARTFAGTGPSNAEIIANKDKTSNLGAYYYFNSGRWHADVEVAQGLLGRRFPSLINGATTGALRQHLDQQYFGYFLTGSYTMSHHIFSARWDFMDYNKGDKWYTAYNPYTESAPGTPRADGADLTPKYHELTLGYTYAFKPESVRAANIKVNYINRAHNFLLPNTTGGLTETGAKGGDSIVVAFQAWF